YLLVLLPRGTHDWLKFVRPSELSGPLRRRGVLVEDLTGLGYDPLDESWRPTHDLSVNYMAFATKAG
ncbi:MAG: bifunctional 3-demethylubiquinol 3-O-methyltransferase/2-polyprenyl-6-hydroxyphenol methylase, partial [Proteobacteria bacterium]|nr:bifunctional 3-demethylubiquinol 3-O-methyltransferase/2-polyprenyl-6-hydroxyphenol methylase [Pseudomonadota bacterium]